MRWNIAPRLEGRCCETAIRLSALLLIALAAAVLLTGCTKAQERRETRDATQTSRETGPPPATVPDPTAAPTQATGPVVSGSAGCGSEVEVGSSVHILESAAAERSYGLYVPAGYEPDAPTPLVLNYHGFGASALEQERYSEYPDAAEKYGFIVVSPQATASPSEWFLYGAIEAEYVDDFAFTNRLLDELSATLCIDESRVYATGISNGGGMTSLAGCELSHRLAAIAPVAGEPYAEARCRDAAPMPIIAFHGTDDLLVPFEAGLDTGRLDHFRFGARANMEDWARHNGCDPTLKTERIAEDVVLESYADCTGGADVHLYIVEGGGHVWPGARDLPGFGYTTQSISATELSWLFFAQHPRR